MKNYVISEDMTMSSYRDVSIMRLTKQNSFTRYHGHDYYEFFFMSQGSLTENRNGRHFLLQPGDSLLIRPGDFHGYPEWRKEEYVFYNMTVRKSLWSELESLNPSLPWQSLKGSKEPRYLNMKGPDSEFCHYTLDWLIRLDNESYRRLGCLNFLSRMALQFWGDPYALKQESLPLWMRKLLDHLNNQEILQKGTTYLRENSPVSYEHLSRLFKIHTGLSPSAFIRSKRLVLARNLLVYSDMSVSEIAEESGYENLSHFHHQFRDETGESPLQYRKKRTLPIIRGDRVL